MDERLLSWYQALQLLALGPCLFVLFFLCVVGRKPSQVFVPVFYFLSLACSFLLPLLSAFTLPMHVDGALLMGESLTPALSFLLIMQFIGGRAPPLAYWAILAVPLLGGSSIVYATVIAKGEVCIYEQICAAPIMFQRLYEIFSGSLTFLLTITIYARVVHTNEDTAYDREHKNAVVLALIMLNLALLGLSLAQANGHIGDARAALAATIMRIGFIYLVLTSVFRVFDRSFEIAYDRVPIMRPSEPSARDLELADKIRQMLVQDKVYREMELSRESLASKLAVTEHMLSRIINQCFSQSFSTLVSHHRILEAKERLTKEPDTSITIIAFEVGFGSIPSFNRVFKQMTGMSPTEFRNAQKPAPS